MITELEIIDLKVGEGKEAVKGALITTHYTGSTLPLTAEIISSVSLVQAV